MDPKAAKNAVVSDSEDANEIAEVYPNNSFYDHVEKNADMHTTNDANQVTWEGSLYALYGGPHQHNSISMMDAFNAQSVQTNKSAATMNFSDANQVAQTKFRTHVHLSHTPTEQSLSKSRITDLFETSLYNVSSDVSVISTQPYHKRRRTGYENSSNTAPTGCLPIFTVSVDRTSLASTLTTDKEYACPKCNMGDGHPIRSYTRKRDTPADKIVSTGTPNSNQEFKPLKTYKNTACFDKHVIAAHIRDFKRSDPPEYVCRYCPCGIVDGHPACVARFAENDLDGLLQHLREFHAHPSMQCINASYDHWCASFSTSFQL